MMKRTLAKRTKEEMERLRARRSERRAFLRERASGDTRIACFLYLGGSDGKLTTSELSFIRRECGGFQHRTAPSLESLSRTVRSFITGCRPPLRERRQLLAQLRAFALCDGPLASEEVAALQSIEELLQLSRQKLSSKRRSWQRPARPDDGPKKSATFDGADSKWRAKWTGRKSSRTPDTSPPAKHWSYEYLGCSEHDSDETIKRAYRRLAVKLHPDKHAARSTTAEERLSHLRAFQKLQQAYEAIWRIRGGQVYP